MAQLQRLLGDWPGMTRRDVFATGLKPENRCINKRFLHKMCSHQGHVVVRVAPGGDSYQIFVLDRDNEHDLVIAEHGPYPSGAVIE